MFLLLPIKQFKPAYNYHIIMCTCPYVSEWRVEDAARVALEAMLVSAAPAARVRPHVLYQYLRVLTEINPHYAHITIDESLEVARTMVIFPH